MEELTVITGGSTLAVECPYCCRPYRRFPFRVVGFAQNWQIAFVEVSRSNEDRKIDAKLPSEAEVLFADCHA
jgi:hypothetical protein